MRGRVWLELARVSNLPTVWTNVLAGWVLAGGGWDGWKLGVLLGGGSLLYTGGMFLNDVADARWDREHRAERPIAAGRVRERPVWIAAVICLMAGLGMVVWGGGANGWVSVALVAAIVGYDLYHKPWKGSVLLMGACRVLLYLMAGSAVEGGLDWTGHSELLVKALALGGYVVGLSLVARSETEDSWDGSRQTGWALLALPAVAALHWNWEERVWVLLCFLAAVIQLRFVFWVCGLIRKPPKSNIGRGVGLLLAGIVGVDALAVLRMHPWLALIFAALMPLLRLWQRKIAAT